ncbi:MAG TPA: hypothetical protein VMM36_09170 [Opitutaceae bacterium]|nr:hypothetical protein [Opitutaceae bacterium]
MQLLIGVAPVLDRLLSGLGFDGERREVGTGCLNLGAKSILPLL